MNWDVVRDIVQLVVAVGLFVATVVLTTATKRYTTATERQAEASAKQATATDLQAKAAFEQAEAARVQADAARHRPYVFLFLDWRWDTIGLRNIGDRVARNVSLTVDVDYVRDGKGFMSPARMAQEPILSLAPGEEVRESRGNAWIRKAGRGDTPVVATVSYGDAEGHDYRETRTIQLDQAQEWVGGSPPRGFTEEERSRYERHGQLMENLGAAKISLERIASAIDAVARRYEQSSFGP